MLLESSNHELPARRCLKTYPSQPIEGEGAWHLHFSLDGWSEVLWQLVHQNVIINNIHCARVLVFLTRDLLPAPHKILVVFPRHVGGDQVIRERDVAPHRYY
jgi:hypothetical protein